MSALSYAGKSVLITGGSGFIGRHLARRLVDDGASVTVLSRGIQPAVLDESTRRSARLAVSSIPYERVDVCDDAALSAIVARGFNFVFHLAAYSGQVPGYADHHQSLSTNCLGLLNVLDAVRRLSPQTVLCFPSSRLVYGRTPHVPVDETQRLAPLSLYGIHKCAGEEYCTYYGERWGIRTVVLRLSNPYGPHEAVDHNRYNVANWMVDEIARRGEVTIFGDGVQLRDYIYVDDAVEAMLVATQDERAYGRVYNVGSGEGVEFGEFVRTAVAIAGGGSMRFEPWPEDHLRVETGDYVAGVSKIRDELSWTARVSLHGGLARTVAAQRRFLSPQPVAATPARIEREAAYAVNNELQEAA